MKTILVDARNDEGCDSRLEAAEGLARLFDARLNCVDITPFGSFITMDPLGGVYALPAIVEHVAEEEEDQKLRLEKWMAGKGLRWDLVQYEGNPAQVLLLQARLADLAIVSLPTETSRITELALAADIAIHSRSPVLAVPTGTQPAHFEGTAFIAWDGSAESAHALRLSVPLLQKALRVHVGTVTDDRVALSAKDAAAYLSDHGIAVETGEWPHSLGSVGYAIYEGAAAVGADYVVAGAYGHSRLREAVLGGATSELIRHSPLPLLIAH